VRQIEKDLPRTFPGHPFFAPDAPGTHVLRRVLLAYSLHNPKIHYCQGMNFVAGLLLLIVEEEDAFWVLDAIVEDILPNYYDYNLGGVQVDSRLAEYYFTSYFPDLKIHLGKLQASPAINSIKWFLSLFVGVFSTQTTLRIWDALLTTGRDVLLKAYLAILRQRFPHILKLKDAAQFYELMTTVPEPISTPKALFSEITKHFLRLFQVDKMRSQSEKVVADEINKREDLRLRTSTHFSITELEGLKREFLKHSSGGQKLTKDQFEKLLRAKVGDDLQLIDNIFKLFDKTRDGVIDFREFCSGLSVYAKGTADERLAFCFSLFDLNSDGFVQPEELHSILQAHYHFLFPAEEADYVKKFVDFATACDVNHDGKLSLDEFKEVINRQPLLMQFLKQTPPPEPYAFKE